MKKQELPKCLREVARVIAEAINKSNSDNDQTRSDFTTQCNDIQ